MSDETRLTSTLTFSGVDYDAQTAKIEATTFGGRHNMPVLSLHFVGIDGGWGQSCGGRVLANAKGYWPRGTELALKIVETVGVDSWEGLPGANVFVLRKSRHGMIDGIASLSGKRVLIFDDFATMPATHRAARCEMTEGCQRHAGHPDGCVRGESS